MSLRSPTPLPGQVPDPARIVLPPVTTPTEQAKGPPRVVGASGEASLGDACARESARRSALFVQRIGGAIVFTRRFFALVVLLILVLTSVACRRSERCATCGMKIDPASPWVSYVVIDGREQPFDTPGCAFAGWRKAGAKGENGRFREYYSQQMKPAKELLFVRSSDVVGPMGPDLVPVDESTARRFARDHNGAPPQSADELLRGEAP
jgi:hypothetical protein